MKRALWYFGVGSLVIAAAAFADSKEDSFQFELSAEDGAFLTLSSEKDVPETGRVDCNAAVEEFKKLVKFSQLGKQLNNAPETEFVITRKGLTITALFPNPKPVTKQKPRSGIDFTWKKTPKLNFENQKITFDSATGVVVREILRAVAQKTAKVPSAYFSRFTHCWDPTSKPFGEDLLYPNCELSCVGNIEIKLDTVEVSEIPLSEGSQLPK